MIDSVVTILANDCSCRRSRSHTATTRYVNGAGPGKRGPGPSLSSSGRIEREETMPATVSVVHSDPEILGGTPVFVGTRVPFRNLIDYLERNHSLEDFLDAFPSVSRE